MDAWSQANLRALEAVAPTVLHVRSRPDEDGNVTVGSGLLFDHHHVVTTLHGVEVGQQCDVFFADGRRARTECIGVDPLYFLTVLKLELRTDVVPPRFAKTADLHAGQVVLAIGNPFGHDLTAAQGIISAPDRTIYRPERMPVDGLIVTTAAIHPGNSGGPLINLAGEVVGLCGIPWSHGLALATQAEVMARVTNQIIEYGRAIHPWLGFSGEPEVIHHQLVELLGLPFDRGVVVQYVADSGPGERAGIEAMDMVVTIADHPVPHLGFIRRVLSGYRHGERVPLTVLRGGQLKQIWLEVEEMPKLRQSSN